MIYIAVLLVALAGAVIQRVTGFGFGIFVMIFFPSIAGSYGEGNALASLLSLVFCTSVCAAYRKYVNWKNIILPVLASFAATYFAVEFMKTQSDKALKTILGVFLVLLSLYFMFFSDRIKIRASWYSGLIAGALSGVLGGLFAMGGPPMVIYFIESEKDINRYMGTIQAYFAVSGILNIAIKASAGFVTPNVLLLWIIGIAGIFAGIFTGSKIQKKINPQLLRRLVYGIIGASGVINIVSALI